MLAIQENMLHWLQWQLDSLTHWAKPTVWHSMCRARSTPMNLSKLIQALTIHKSQHPSLLKSTCPGLHLQGLQLRPPLVHSALSLCQGMKLSIVIILKGFHYPLLHTPKPTNCLQKLSISAIHSYSATRFHHGRLSSSPVDSHSETSEDSWQSQVSRQKERFYCIT